MWVICTCLIHTNHPRQTGEQMSIVILVYPPYLGGWGWRGRVEAKALYNDQQQKQKKKKKNDTISLFPMSGMGTDLNEKLWNLGQGVLGHAPPKKISPQKIKIYAIWGYPEVFYMEIKWTFLSARPLTGTTSMTTRWKPPRLVTPVCTPLLLHLNWDKHQLSWSSSSVKWPPSSYMSLFGVVQQLKNIFKNKTKQNACTKSFEFPSGFSHLQLTRPIQLLLLIPIPTYRHSCSYRTFHHGLSCNSSNCHGESFTFKTFGTFAFS